MHVGYLAGKGFTIVGFGLLTVVRLGFSHVVGTGVDQS